MREPIILYMECNTTALYHACENTLAPLNKFHYKLLKELGIFPADALVHFNLAPLACRRDIAMMGYFVELCLAKDMNTSRSFQTINSRPPMYKIRDGAAQQTVDRHPQRKYLGNIKTQRAVMNFCIYGRLPAAIIRHDTMKEFQRSLQPRIKDRLAAGCSDWMTTFSTRVPAYGHPLR